MKPVFEHTAAIGCRVQLGRHAQELQDAAAGGSSIMASFGFGAQNTALTGTLAAFRTRQGQSYGPCSPLMKSGQAFVRWGDGSDGTYSIGASGRYDLCLCEGNKVQM